MQRREGFITEQIKKYTDIIGRVLSKKRFNHSLNVADMCFQLAQAYGEDSIKAYTAGILHDIMKEQPPEDLEMRVKLSRLSPDPVELVTPALWHAVAGAAYVRDELHIADGELINAIRFHTIGRANMTVLEKIVYLGDLVSKDRQFDDVEKYRELAFKDLDAAMYAALKLSVTETLEKNGQIPAYTINAYNYYNKLQGV